MKVEILQNIIITDILIISLITGEICVKVLRATRLAMWEYCRRYLVLARQGRSLIKMATKKAIAQKRMFHDVFVCKKCNQKFRSQAVRVTAGKVKCPRCDGKSIRPVRKK